MKVKIRAGKSCFWEGVVRGRILMASGSAGLFRFNELGMSRALELGPHVVTMEMPRTSIVLAILSCTLAIITVIVTVSNKKKASLGAYRYRNGGRELPSKVTGQLC